MSGKLYIAAKAPRIGLAKTRLGRAIGHEAAVGLYSAFLCDLSARFANAPFPAGWYITPPDAWPDIEPLVCPGGRVYDVLVQGEGDWTERQRVLFRGAASRGEERVVLVASDSPQLTVDVVSQAFSELERHELVLGPVYDGGYYLIGMRGWYDVLRDLPMSTATVLDDIIARSQSAGLSVAQLEPTFDIDELEDLQHLQQVVTTRCDLPATRGALEALELLERLTPFVGGAQ